MPLLVFALVAAAHVQLLMQLAPSIRAWQAGTRTVAAAHGRGAAWIRMASEAPTVPAETADPPETLSEPPIHAATTPSAEVLPDALTHIRQSGPVLAWADDESPSASPVPPTSEVVSPHPIIDNVPARTDAASGAEPLATMADAVVAPAGASPGQVQDDLPAARGTVHIALIGSGTTHFSFLADGHRGEARLHWALTQDRYRLTLERRSADRTWPTWHSEGRVGAHGLQPERHELSRSGRVRELLSFEHAHGKAEPPVWLHANGHRYAMPEGVQDRLSWWLQLPAMAAAAEAQHHRVLRVPVAHARGFHWWDFELLGRDGPRLHLRRSIPRSGEQAALTWELWVDTRQSAWPQALRFEVNGVTQWTLSDPDTPASPDAPDPWRPPPATDETHGRTSHAPSACEILWLASQMLSREQQSSATMGSRPG